MVYINVVSNTDISEDSAVDNDLSDDSIIIRNISKQYKDPKEYMQKMKSLVSEKKMVGVKTVVNFDRGRVLISEKKSVVKCFRLSDRLEL
ncbi:hypothetical protein TNCV_1831441 [Trichonephila clavipes]|nr:hypothetical protein TNCV_1831441 [Trichonephila clavipes]